MFVELQLRQRRAEVVEGPPPVEAFLHGARMLTEDSELVLDLLAPIEPTPAGQRQAYAVEASIPLPAAEPTTEVGAWALAARPRVRAAVAALWAAGGVAVAQEAEVGAEPSAAPAPVVEPAEAPDAERAAEPGVEQAVAEPAAADPHSVLWAALARERVRLTLQGGYELVGAVVADRGDAIYLAQEPDGAVLTVSKADITLVRLIGMERRMGAESKELALSFGDWDVDVALRKAKGLRNGGIVLTSLGLASVLTVALGTAASSSFVAYSWPLLIGGGATLCSGIPMWIVGDKRVRDAHWVERERRVTVTGGITPRVGGWSGGLQLVF